MEQHDVERSNAAQSVQCQCIHSLRAALCNRLYSVSTFFEIGMLGVVRVVAAVISHSHSVIINRFIFCLILCGQINRELYIDRNMGSFRLIMHLHTISDFELFTSYKRDGMQ